MDNQAPGSLFQGDNRRKNVACPQCGYKFLARQGDDVVCMWGDCNWRISAKRYDDYKIPLIRDLKINWNGQ